MRSQQQHTTELGQLRQTFATSVQIARGKRRPLNTANSNIREVFSANVHHLLPDIPMRQHAAIYQDVLLHQSQAEMEEDCFFLLDHIHIDDQQGVLRDIQDRPVIFATFHYGSYRLINILLVSRNVNYVLPLETEHHTTQGQAYLDRSQEVQHHFNSTSQFTVIDAEKPTSALTMARKARAGWSLLGYLDGNTGVQSGAQQDSKLLRVSLLGKPIYARKGIPFLAHFLKLPIVPVFCEITDGVERRMTFHDPIVPSPESDRGVFCMAATQQLYTLLGEYVQRNPSQWLGWLDMQKYLDLDALTATPGSVLEALTDHNDVREVSVEKLVFNRERFGFIVRENERVLLDKLTYEVLTVPESVFAVLDACQEPVAVSNYMSGGQKEVIEKLLSLELLTAVSSAVSA